MKPTHADLLKKSRSDIVPFVAASVGRLSNLYPHWMLLHVETPLGISRSRLMVMWLLHSEESMTMGEIAQAIDLTPRGVTRIIDGLEAEGLVNRTPSTTDKRVKQVKLTMNGLRFVQTSFPMANAEFSRLFSALDKSEAVEFIRVLEKLTDQMKLEIDEK